MKGYEVLWLHTSTVEAEVVDVPRPSLCCKMRPGPRDPCKTSCRRRLG